MIVKRLPEPVFFQFGSIKFKRDVDLYFRVKIWNKDGYSSIENQYFKVKDEKHLKELQNLKGKSFDEAIHLLMNNDTNKQKQISGKECLV